MPLRVIMVEAMPATFKNPVYVTGKYLFRALLPLSALGCYFTEVQGLFFSADLCYRHAAWEKEKLNKGNFGRYFERSHDKKLIVNHL